jgi:transposase
MAKSIREKFNPKEKFEDYEIVGLIPRENKLIEIHMKRKESIGEVSQEECICPQCNSNNTRKYGNRVRALRALPLNGYHIVLKIKTIDCECLDCGGKIFMMQLFEKDKGNISGGQQYTFAFIELVKDLYKNKNMSIGAIAKKLYISQRGAYNIANDIAREATRDTDDKNGLSFEGLIRRRMLATVEFNEEFLPNECFKKEEKSMEKEHVDLQNTENAGEINGHEEKQRRKEEFLAKYCNKAIILEKMRDKDGKIELPAIEFTYFKRRKE